MVQSIWPPDASEGGAEREFKSVTWWLTATNKGKKVLVLPNIKSANIVKLRPVTSEFSHCDVNLIKSQTMLSYQSGTRQEYDGESSLVLICVWWIWRPPPPTSAVSESLVFSSAFGHVMLYTIDQLPEKSSQISTGCCHTADKKSS